ncbi:MAG: NAD-dependent epimerase/dehydratase family protein [Desulfovibrionaceae bacterium]|jgi:nucleoside-diphosphate-sugar epimerase|nr:NAD-dependent epimerase/dehydratase family protein [Desulfovibrionaceae bacterium]
MTDAPLHGDAVMRQDVADVAAADLPWDTLRGSTVLVSGGAGFLAAYMVRVLLHLNRVRDAGITVQCMVRDAAKARARFAGLRQADGLRLLVQDVCEPVPPEVAADFVVHAASPASPKYYAADPTGVLLANTLGTMRLLEHARARGCKGFLFISSGEVYGEVDPARIPTREQDYGYVDPTAVRSCYAEGKRAGETMCVSWAHQYGVPTTIARPFHTYGPGMDLADGRVFADFVADVLARRDIRLLSDGSARRTFCYLADAALGFFTVLLKGEAATPYNVSNEDCETSIAELAELLAGLFPERGLQVVRAGRAANDAYMASPISRNRPDTARLRSLGWRPAHSLRQGFLKTVRSFE